MNICDFTYPISLNIYLSTKQLTPWSRVIFEKLIVSQLVRVHKSPRLLISDAVIQLRRFRLRAVSVI